MLAVSTPTRGNESLRGLRLQVGVPFRIRPGYGLKAPPDRLDETACGRMDLLPTWEHFALCSCGPWR